MIFIRRGKKGKYDIKD